MDTTDEIHEAFSTAAATTLRDLTGLEIVARNTLRATGPDGFHDISAILILTSGIDGFMILSFPSSVALELASRVLDGVNGAPDEEMVRDCVAEVLNVVAGQAKTLLYGTPNHYTLSTPTLLPTGSCGAVPAGERWVIEFACEIGEFSLHVRLPEV